MNTKNERKHKIQDYDKIDYASFWSNSRKRKYLGEIERCIIGRLDQPSDNNWAIDIGCGFGRLSEIYLNKYKKVVLFDYSRKLLLQAAERLRDNDNIIFIQGDVYNLPFKDNSFDIIFMIRLFHHLGEPKRTFSELRRILKNKGRFLFTFYNKYDFRARYKSFFNLKPTNLSKTRHENVSKDGLLYLSDPAYVDKLLGQYNFDIRSRYGVGLFIGRFLRYSKVLGFIEKYLYNVSGRFNLTTEIFIQATLKKLSGSI